MKALIVVAAISLSVDALYDVLDELVPLLRRGVADCGSTEGQHDDGAASEEETAARRQLRRIEREGALLFDLVTRTLTLERRRARRRARESALQREILRSRRTTACRKLRVPVSDAISLQASTT